MKRWKINSKDELSKILKAPIDDIEKSFEELDIYYKNKIEIPKKNGIRIIYNVDKKCRLYLIQKNFKKNYLENILISDRAYGFVKDTNYFNYLQEHLNLYKKNIYLRIDIKNFFGSIHANHIEEAFDFYVEGDEKEDVINLIKNIVLYNDQLIQGTPVAPSISNIVFRPLDIRIEKYCLKQNINYSRYADDLLFSTEKGTINRRFIKTIERILYSKGFLINYDKLRISHNAISLNGFVVDKGVRLSRKKIKPISGMVYYLEHNEFVKKKEWYEKFNSNMSSLGCGHFKNGNEIINVLAGNRAFLINSIKESNEQEYKDRCNRLINRIEKQISYISNQ